MLDTNSASLADAAEGRLDARVPACPDWTVADLVFHVGSVHRFWHQVAQRKPQDHSEVQAVVQRPARPPDEDLVPWFRDGAGPLIATLRSSDMSEPVWTWSSRKEIGFIPRRMAQETAVHRWDAQGAAGSPAPIDAALAADGIDEFVTIMLEAEETPPAIFGSIGIAATDTGEAWTVVLSRSGAAVSRGSAGSDAGIEARASDLLLALWRRRPLEGLAVSGDTGLAQAFVGWCDLN